MTPSAAGQLMASTREWVRLADELDEVDLALGLLDCTPQDDPLRRCRLLLARGDVDGAYRALGPQPEPTPVPGAPYGPPHLFAAACRAALGDQASYRWLMQAAADNPGWMTEFLIAVVTEQHGDRATADSAWWRQASVWNIRTGYMAARAAAAHVSQRGGHERAEQVGRFADAAFLLDQGAHVVERDPRPVLEAARRLVERGDRAGAGLLLHMITRRNPDVRRISTELDRLVPRAEHRRRRWVVGVLLAATLPLIVALGAAGVIAAFVGAVLFQKHVPLPGLTREESDVWRAAQAVRFDKTTGLPTAGNQLTPDGGWYALAAIGGLIIGTLLGAGLTAAISPTGNVAVGIWMLSLIGLPVLSVWLLRLWLLPRRARREAFRARDARRVSAAVPGACECWNTHVLFDENADSYVSYHLRPLDSATLGEQASQQFALRVLECPSLGTTWLYARLTRKGATLLLRGASASAQQDPTQVGMYL